MKPYRKCPSGRGHLFIISAPAGTGKSTLINRLKKELDYVKETVSCTTRCPRPGEVHGVDYFFITPDQFNEALHQDAFLEWVCLYSYYYGTLKHQVQRLQNEENHVILVIDTQGAMKLKGEVDATFIFISPPSLQELKNRLKTRGTEGADEINRRLARAKNELSLAGEYDYHIVNDNLETAYATLKGIIAKEERRH